MEETARRRRRILALALGVGNALLLGWLFIGLPRDLLVGLGPVARAWVRARGEPGGFWLELELRDGELRRDLDHALRYQFVGHRPHLSLPRYELILEDAAGQRRTFRFSPVDFSEGSTPSGLRDLVLRAEETGFEDWQPLHDRSPATRPAPSPKADPPR